MARKQHRDHVTTSPFSLPTITGNSSMEDGGAIAAVVTGGSSLEISGGMIFDNDAAFYGGGHARQVIAAFALAA